MASSLILVVGPLYVYRDGFTSIATVIPPLGSLVVILIGIITLLLIIPYAIGYLSNLRLSASLKESVKDFISRAEVLSKRHEGDYREQEENKLQGKIIQAYTALKKNMLLYFFALKLLEKFDQEAHTDDHQKRRLTMLQNLGFGKTAPYEDNPVTKMRQIRTAIKEKPFYRFNVPVQSYFGLVENDLEMVAQADPLLLNFGKLTKILGALVDEDPDREDIFADLRPSEQPGGKIRPSVPGWVLAALTTYILTPLSTPFFATLQATSEVIGNGLSDQLWRLLGLLVGAG